MKARCTNPKTQQWKDYGGRGIIFAPQWDRFDAFLADMGECPVGLTLDRIDNDKGYGPDNCRWTNYKTQFRNRRGNQWVRVAGQRMIFTDACHAIGVKCGTASGRVSKKGCTHQEAIDWYIAKG